MKPIELNERQQHLLQKIKDISVHVDWDVAFDGKARGNLHLFRVQTIAEHLLSTEKTDPFLTRAGAWTHDISLAFGSDYDPQKVLAATLDFLVQHIPELTGTEAQTLAMIAASHEEGDGTSMEAKIVHDADVLDKSGVLGVIRHIWKMTNMLENRVLSGEADLEKLRTHLLSRQNKVSTPRAKELLTLLSEKQRRFFDDRAWAMQIMTQISQLAWNGKISDEIAEFLIDRYPHRGEVVFLKTQLNCTYLVTDQESKNV